MQTFIIAESPQEFKLKFAKVLELEAARIRNVLRTTSTRRECEALEKEALVWERAAMLLKSTAVVQSKDNVPPGIAAIVI